MVWRLGTPNVEAPEMKVENVSTLGDAAVLFLSLLCRPLSPALFFFFFFILFIPFISVTRVRFCCLFDHLFVASLSLMNVFLCKCHYSCFAFFVFVLILYVCIILLFWSSFSYLNVLFILFYCFFKASRCVIIVGLVS